MATIDALEGTISDAAWWRYDLAGDVLYLRLARERQTPTYAEETDDGSYCSAGRMTTIPSGLRS